MIFEFFWYADGIQDDLKLPPHLQDRRSSSCDVSAGLGETRRTNPHSHYAKIGKYGEGRNILDFIRLHKS